MTFLSGSTWAQFEMKSIGLAHFLLWICNTVPLVATGKHSLAEVGPPSANCLILQQQLTQWCGVCVVTSIVWAKFILSTNLLKPLELPGIVCCPCLYADEITSLLSSPLSSLLQESWELTEVRALPWNHSLFLLGCVLCWKAGYSHGESQPPGRSNSTGAPTGLYWCSSSRHFAQWIEAQREKVSAEERY